MADSKTRPSDLAESEQDELQRKRFEYARRCDDLIAALKMQANLLRGAVPIDTSAERRAIIGALPALATVETLENTFSRIDALWAAWTRPDLAAKRNPDSVARHLRRVFLAALDTSAHVLDLEQTARALARDKLGRALDDEDCALVAGPGVDHARAIVDGLPMVLLDAKYGVPMITSDRSVEEMADGPGFDGARMVRFLLEENGYVEHADRLPIARAEAALVAWRRAEPGRPKKDDAHEPKWDVIVDVLEGIDAYVDDGDDDSDERRRRRAVALQKDWQAFRRERGPRRGSRTD